MKIQILKAFARGLDFYPIKSVGSTNFILFFKNKIKSDFEYFKDKVLFRPLDSYMACSVIYEKRIMRPSKRICFVFGFYIGPGD